MSKEYNPQKILLTYKKEFKQLLGKLKVHYPQFRKDYPHLAEALESYKSEHGVNLATRGVIADLEKEMVAGEEETERMLKRSRGTPKSRGDRKPKYFGHVSGCLRRTQRRTCRMFG